MPEDPEVDPQPPEAADGGPVSRAVLDAVLGEGSVVEQVDVQAPPTVRRVAGGRHELRERAVHLLYELQMKDVDADELLAAQVLAPDEYTERLVRGVLRHRDELDLVIDELARGWSIERMATMDVVILRVACYELAHEPEVPRAVVLAEAVDLAASYGSTDDSATFVNGLLAAAADQLRPV